MLNKRSTLVILIAASLLFVSLFAQAVEINLVWLIDESGSIDAADLDLEIDGMKQALNNVVIPFSAAGNTVRIAVISFGTDVHDRLAILTDVSTTAGRVAVENALDDIRNNLHGGSTNMSGAIARAETILAAGPSGRSVVNLVTDGGPDSSVTATSAATALKSAGFELWTLGVGASANNAYLETIVGPSPPAGNFPVASFSDIAAAEEEKLGAIFSTACPPGACQESEVSWWYRGEHDEVCTSGADYCVDSDHWGVELATYFCGDYAYTALDAARRFMVDEITDFGFTYYLLPVMPTPDVNSGPSGALWLFEPVTGMNYLAISEAAPTQTNQCQVFDATAVNWWWGTARAC